MARLAHLPALLALSALPGALGWGKVGHWAVAYVATDFMAPGTLSYVQSLLSDPTVDAVANAANWADGLPGAYAFTRPLHYIDAHDSPPDHCGVDLVRDCPADEGCVVTAIANYTARVAATNLAPAQRVEAAKFLIHFVGDLGQPLHTEALDDGGSKTRPVRFDGQVETGGSLTLHKVWDTEILMTLTPRPREWQSQDNARAWATQLSAEVRNGSYNAARWAASVDLAEPIASIMNWTRESNELVCKYVLPQGLAGVKNGIDLSKNYTRAAGPKVAEQVAKHGYILAKWLDAIVAATKV